MSDTEKYILETIKTCVWSGFYSPEDVQHVIDDILEADVNENMLRAAVAPEFGKKAEAEARWPDETDCDRLDDAFESMNSEGIIGLQNAGYTMSDGMADVGEELQLRERSGVKGYCFYHGQDLDRAVSGGGLVLAFGDLNDEQDARIKVGKLVRDIVERHGFDTEWDDDPETRINIPEIEWKRRGPI